MVASPPGGPSRDDGNDGHESYEEHPFFRRRPISVRLPEWLDMEFRELCVHLELGPSTMLRRIVEEWWVMSECDHLEFRDTEHGRVAALRGGPEVWKLIWWGRSYLPDEPERFVETYGWLASEEALRQALDYAERFPEPIDRMLRFERYAAQKGKEPPAW